MVAICLFAYDCCGLLFHLGFLCGLVFFCFYPLWAFSLFAFGLVIGFVCFLALMMILFSSCFGRAVMGYQFIYLLFGKGFAHILSLLSIFLL